MSAKAPLRLSIDQCVDHIVAMFGKDIRIGMPLGLGKPVPLVNAIYRRACQDPSIQLTIFTALSLEKPTWSNELERRFLQPFVERVWNGVPDIDYMTDLRQGRTPGNVRIHELFFKAGGYANEPAMQRQHICSNYTHSVRDCTINGNQIFAHMIASEQRDGVTRYSASCNADTSTETLRLFEAAIAAGEKRLRIGMVNSHLPYMYGKDAEYSEQMYDIIIDGDECDHALFATPRLPVTDADYLIGVNVSTLIRDGGTLQIGIGALGDAIAYGLSLRHRDNAAFRRLAEDSGVVAHHRRLIDETGGLEPFVAGLYGSTEMLVDAFMQLYRAGVLTRVVYPHAGIQALINDGRIDAELPANILDLLIDSEAIHPYLSKRDFAELQQVGVLKDSLRYEAGELVEGALRLSANLADRANRERVAAHCLGTQLRGGVVATGGFFLGPADFYASLRAMDETERRRFEMAGVDVANQLYGGEPLRALQRREGRFCNTGMMATLLGHVVSDGLEDGTVVSGVGGQYNFVAMAHALPDGRLIMMIKSTRSEHGETASNIVFNYGHVTVPRHLRDIIVTEYGIADIRGLCDEEIIKAMLNVADSRFQAELLEQAKASGKLSPDYQIPEAFRNNLPGRLADILRARKAVGLFPPFPFGSELTPVEMALAAALKTLKARAHDKAALGSALAALPQTPPARVRPMLARLGLENPQTPDEAGLQKTALLALKLAGMLGG